MAAASGNFVFFFLNENSFHMIDACIFITANETYWLPKLHKNIYKARFIANSSFCMTTELSKGPLTVVIGITVYLLPIILIKMKVYQMLPSSFISSLLVSIL